jgi:uncharacterized protein (PEP-CTERM system associated)
MITTDLTKNPHPEVTVSSRAGFFVAFLVAFGFPGSASAEFEGEIKLGASLTDNIRLATAPNEEDETVYQVVPSFSYLKESPRISTELNYQLEYYRYKELDDSATYHLFDGQVAGQLIKDALSLTVGAARTQSIVDPDQVLPPGNLPVTDNLTDRDEFFVSPWLTTALGRSLTLNTGYRYTDVRYDDGLLQNHEIQFAQFEIQNYRRARGVTWAARYNWNETEYEFSLPWEYQQASLELGFWTNESLRLFASGGKESAWDDFEDRSLQDPFWEAGFAYNSGDRIGVEFAIGERSFGDSWRGQLSWKFRRGETRFSYSENPTTMGDDR